MPGYNLPLYILAFDHRSFFTKAGFSPEQIKEFKQIIYQGFLLGVEGGVPETGAAILVDEEYGAEIHKDASERGFINILTTEKSGQDVFEFQYGDDFAEHIEAIKPVFAKALVRYRADGDQAQNDLQLGRLKQLSDWCHDNGRGFLIEPLVSPTADEKKTIGQEKFDSEMRPDLTVKMIRQFQEFGVEPDIWKIEGMDSSADYARVVEQARADGRDEVSCVVLGRAESEEHVERWLTAGKEVEGMVGFAIGRTIFWDALQAYAKGEIDAERAADAIGANYLHFYQVFTS